MQDAVFGILFLGFTTGIIPVILILLLIQGLIWLFKGAGASIAVLNEKEPPPQPVARNIREELWEERDGDFLEQLLQGEDSDD